MPFFLTIEGKMSLCDCTAIVLAAGKGTRMRSSLPKVLHTLVDKPLIYYPLRLLRGLSCQRIVVVVGHGSEAVEAYLSAFGVSSVRQEEQLGTGHAVSCALSLLDQNVGHSLIMCGDMPLFRRDTISAFYKSHRDNRNHLTILSTSLDEPTGYGRIVRSTDGTVLRIVEEKDATPEERQIKEVNTGTYLVENRLLFDFLDKIDNKNRQGEYYLTDLVGILKDAGLRVGAYEVEDSTEALGVNSRLDLSKAEAVLLERIRRRHMENGVTLQMATSTFIGSEVEIENDVVIGPFAVIKGKTRIGKGAIIGAFSYIENVTIQKGAHLPPYTMMSEE